jgi:hypothetical protein
MLCLSDSIRHDDPAVQRLLSVVEEAQTLTQLLLAVAYRRVLCIQHKLLGADHPDVAMSGTTWVSCCTTMERWLKHSNAWRNPLPSVQHPWELIIPIRAYARKTPL